MTTPSIIKRALTFDFSSSVEFPGQPPATMEVAVIAVSDEANPTANATYIDPSPQVQTVLLTQATNSVVFYLVPSNAPGLVGPVTYRAMWREGVTGRTYTQDFQMPDQDCHWAQLQSLGALISGASYLQQSDLGVPGRVAQLNSAGQVVDSHGTPVATAGDITSVTGMVTAEQVARQQAVNNLNTTLLATLNQQVGQAETTLLNALNAQDIDLESQISQGDGTVTNLVNAETVRAEAAEQALHNQVAANSTNLTTVMNSLDNKADLVGGTVPLSEIPQAAITTVVPVANVGAMLSMDASQIKPGWIASVTGSGSYLYLGPTTGTLANWYNLTQVLSVNGKTGAVVLVPSDIGALAANGTIQQSQVAGLAAALATLTPLTTTQVLQTQVNGIQNDTTIPHLVSGLLPKADMPVDSVFVDNNELVTKDGTVLSGLGGGGGGSVSSVNGKIGIVVLGPSDVGALPVNQSIPESQVINLVTQLNTIDNNISTLQTDVTTLQSGSGGTTVIDGGTPASTGGGTPPSAASWVFWDAPSLEFGSTPGTLAGTTQLHSPFGIDVSGATTGTVNDYYINPAGAQPSDVVYPYITPNGHLQLRQWNESNPVDPPLALQSDLSALTTTVAAKANEADLVTLQNNAATVTQLNSTNSAVSSLQNQVNGMLPITESQVTNLVSDLAGKASLIGGTVPLSQLPGIPQTQVLNLGNTLAQKADLVSGTVPLTEMPQNIPQSYVANLSSALGGKADLVGGTVPLSELPALPQTQVQGLTSALAGKADLVNGVLASSQIPAIALDTPQSVASTAAMTALSSTSVHVGTVCIVTGGSGQGSYILSTSDPSQLANWLPLNSGTSPVTSVNGYVGTVVLAASDVGAWSSSSPIPQSGVQNLTSTLATFATTTALNTAVAPLQSATQVQNTLSASVPIKALVNYVATSAVPSLSGQQTIDGVLVSVGSVVLLTAQSASVNNGIWTVNSSSWSRPTDYATNAYFIKDTVVMVSSGNNNANTFWQETAASGVVDTNNSTWAKVMTAGPPLVYTAGNGVTITGTSVAVTPVVGGGILSSGSGVQVDTSIVARKYSTTIGDGTHTTLTVTHNLGTTDLTSVFVRDTGSNNQVLVCPTIVNSNSFTLEFASAPATGQYRVSVSA